MTTLHLTTPGLKVRTTTRRRYVAVDETAEHTAEGLKTRAAVIMRSDNLATLATKVRRQGKGFSWGTPFGVGIRLTRVYDTVTGQEVPTAALDVAEARAKRARTVKA